MNTMLNSTNVPNIYAFLKENYGFSQPVVTQLIEKLRTAPNSEIYVGRVTGSSIYRIAVGDLNLPYVLKFRTPTERDRFMMSFQKICTDMGRQVVKSY